MIKIKEHGDFSKLTGFLERAKGIVNDSLLNKYGELGIEKLYEATPKDTGKTAASWEYSIERKSDCVKLCFYNTNIQNGVPVAVVLQYGHATPYGSWVEGRDYINPAMQTVMEQIKQELWEEANKR